MDGVSGGAEEEEEVNDKQHCHWVGWIKRRQGGRNKPELGI